MKPVLPPHTNKSLRTAIAATALAVMMAFAPSLAHAACANPVGNEGMIIYNDEFSTLQFCDDTNWIAMDGRDSAILKIKGVGDWESSEDDFLSWTPGTAASSNTQQTFSFWYKRESNTGSNLTFFGSWPGGASVAASWAVLGGDNRIYMGFTDASNNSLQLFTGSNTFTDTSDWHHVLIQFDMTQTTLTNKMRLWVDGASIPLGLVTGDDEPFTNVVTSLANGVEQAIGTIPSDTAGDFDGLISEFHAIDGALVPVSSFYSSGRALAYRGPHGNNGFYLNFSNGSNIGQDFSGRGNNFTNTGVTQNVDYYPLSGTGPSNLVRHWEFETRTGGNIIDSVDNMICFLGGVHSTVPGRFRGNGIRFDNGNAFCNPLTELANRTQLTLTGWVRRTAPNDKAFFGGAPDGNNAFFINIENDGLAKFVVSNGSLAGGDFAMNDSEWHHVAMVFDGSLSGNADRLRAYIDGLPVTLSFYGTVPATTSASVNNLYISGDTSATWDDARIYHRALTQAEVQAIMGLCSNPSGTPGDIVYSSITEEVLYCNSQNWVSISPRSTIPNATSLLAHYKFDHTAGTTLVDSTGTYNGTLSNFTLPAAWTAGHIGSNALNFDGMDDYVSLVPFSFNPASAYTWAMWINPDDFEEWNTVTGAYINPNTSPTMAISAHTTADSEWGPVTAGISAGIDQAGASINVHSTNNVLTTGTWAHVAVTYDGGLSAANRFKIYVNGADVTSTDVAILGSLGTSNFTNVRIGHNGWSDEFFDGRMDDYRFYNRVLSLGEIQMLAGYGPAPGTCTNPAANAGMMIYNNTANVVQYCNGKDWVAAGR